MFMDLFEGDTGLVNVFMKSISNTCVQPTLKRSTLVSSANIAQQISFANEFGQFCTYGRRLGKDRIRK